MIKTPVGDLIIIKSHTGVFQNAYMHFAKRQYAFYYFLSIWAFLQNANVHYLMLKCIWAFCQTPICVILLFFTGVFPKRRSAPPFPINSSSLLQQCRSFSPVFLLICLSPSMLLLFLILWFLVTFFL